MSTTVGNLPQDADSFQHATTFDPRATRSRLDASPLRQGGGYRVARIVSERGLGLLAHEAFAQLSAGRATTQASPDHEDKVRGRPARWLESAPGGRALAAFFASAAVLALLRRLTGLRWVPSGLQGTYSYYRRAGHYLGLHRDVEACDLALITCLHDKGGDPSTDSGALSIYPSRIGAPLAEIRNSPRQGRVTVRLKPGESLVLLGGLIPHRLNEMREGHVRVVSPLCYQVEGSSRGG